MEGEIWSMYCLSDNTDTINVSSKVFALSTKTKGNKTIGFFGNQTDVDQSYSGNSNLILSYNDYEIINGEQLEIGASVYLESDSGIQNEGNSPVNNIKQIHRFWKLYRELC